MRLKSSIAALMAGAVLASCSTLGTGAQAPQGVAKADAEASLKMPDMPLHDPWIIADKASRTYYLYTKNEPPMTGVQTIGTMVYSSKNLRDWTKPKIVFQLPEGIWANEGAWAPNVHVHNGRYYLFTTLHNESAPLPPGATKRPNYRRGTVIAVADRPEGPFTLLNGGEPVAPSSLMTLDGSLWTENGQSWMVYAHEWIQTRDGTIEAIPLDEDLHATGKPIVLFKASDADWPAAQKQPEGDSVYVTDGPELFRTRTGKLLMLWSSWGSDGYVQSIARSATGKLAGPWEQLPPLVRGDSGHGMLFNSFDGKLMLVMHRPFHNARGKIYEVRDAGDRLEIVRQRIDLDGDPPEAARFIQRAGG